MTKRPPEVAYEVIKKKIINGEYYPSQRLIEEQLAKSLSLGRHNVRTALHRLQAEGLVDIEPNRGATVASVTLDEALDILTAREVLEMAVTEAAAKAISDEELDFLEKCIREMKAALENNLFDEYSQINRRFHQTIYDACGNENMPWLIRLLRERMARLQLRTILIPGRSSNSFNEHKAIYEALRARDPVAARNAIKKHIRSLAETVQSAWDLVRM